METAQYYSSKNLFFNNFISNVGYFALNTLIGILFVPYLINRLGVSVYGLVPLTMSLASYFNVITILLNSAAWRSMTISLQKDDGSASQIFNSSFWASLFIAFILLILGLLLSLFVNRWFNVPAGNEAQAVLLVIFTMAAFSIFSVCSSLGVITYSLNRLDLQNLGNTFGLIARVTVILVLFNSFGPSLWHVGAGLVASALTILLVDIWAWKYLLPEIKINIKEVSLLTLKLFSKTSFWLIINRFGTIILVSANLIIANKLFDPESSGRYASVLQWSIFLSNFGIVVSAIFGPKMMAFYAKKDIDGLVSYAKKGVKFIGLLLALPIGLICGFSQPLLDIWLGPSFVSLALLMSIMTFHLCANLAFLPLDTIILATNKVRLAAITQILLVAFNIVLSVGFSKGLGLGLYGIAFSGAIVLVCKNMIFNPIYSALLLGKPAFTFLRKSALLIIAPSLVSLISYWISLNFTINSWFKFLTGCSVVAVIYSVFVWKYMLNSEERSSVLDFFRPPA